MIVFAVFSASRALLPGTTGICKQGILIVALQQYTRNKVIAIVVCVCFLSCNNVLTRVRWPCVCVSDACASSSASWWRKKWPFIFSFMQFRTERREEEQDSANRCGAPIHCVVHKQHRQSQAPCFNLELVCQHKVYEVETGAGGVKTRLRNGVRVSTTRAHTKRIIPRACLHDGPAPIYLPTTVMVLICGLVFTYTCWISTLCRVI